MIPSCKRALAVLIAFLAGSYIILPSTGCRSDRPARVVVYCAHDREFAAEILDTFQKRSGLEVLVRYDTEANKSVGLYEELIREAIQPRCDVHWNNEILATIRLQQCGVLQPYDSPAAAPYPAAFRAGDHTWTAFAARARILLINTDRVKKDEFPRRLEELNQPRWKKRVAMAKPLFGTTATQAACLFQAWGAEKARQFYQQLHANEVLLAPGNKQVAVGVGAGQYDVGLTDTDDAMAEIEAGRPVALLYPDRDAPPGSKEGVLFIPNTVAMINKCPNPDGARQLIDYLLSVEVETRLAHSKSRQIPLNPQVKLDTLWPVETPQTVHALPVDFVRAAEVWKESQEFLVKEFALR